MEDTDMQATEVAEAEVSDVSEVAEVAPTPKKFGTFNDILKADDRPLKEVEVPEWNMWVRMLTLTGTERDLWANLISGRMVGVGDNAALKNVQNLRVMLLQKVLVKEDLEPLMDKKQIHDLNKKNGEVINRLYLIASEMNGLSDEDAKNTAKNSKSGQSEEDGT